jgi:UDP-glucose 4-epimerase
MNALVVGGAGYIGSIVAEELVRARHSAIVLDDLSTGYRAAVPPLALLIEGSIADPAARREAFTTKSIDCVIHLAAKSIASESVAHPDLYEHANVAMGAILLDAMREHGVRHLVFSSTAAVYDASAPMPLREDSPLRPGNPYGETKLRFEAMLREREASDGLRSVTLRYFNVAGASIDRGENHRDETHLIPLVIDAARGAKGPVPIYGTDYPTGDGTAIRDYIHVIDIGDAHLRAMRHLADGGASVTLNLGTGTGSSVRQVIRSVEEVTGLPVPTTEASRRPGDPPVLIASADSARRVLGWTRQFEQLSEMIETAWEWRQRFPEGYEE